MTQIQRADVPQEQTWNRESVFASWDDFKAEVKAIAEKIPDLAKYSGHLGDSPDALLDYFNDFYPLRRRMGRLEVFVGLANAVDTSDTEAKSQAMQVASLFSQLAGVTAFAEPELLEIGDTLLQWAKDNDDLAVYKHYFDNILRQKQYSQSPEIEKILGTLGEVFAGPYQTYGELVSTDLKFPPAQDSQGQSQRVAQAIVPPTGIKSADRILRKDAWEKFADGHRSVENTLASNLITNMKQHVFLSRTRGYESVLEAQLSPSNLPMKVFHTLVDTFEANQPVWHRYWEAKRKALKVDSLHPYDIWAPITDNPPQISYEQAIDYISAGLEPMGEDYVSVLRKGALEDRWVDYAQNEGRTQGAFASASYDCHPFIFNTFDGSLTAMSVLAHELGHAMHSYWMNEHQPEVYNGYFANGMSASVAETASNFHQAMTRAYLMDTQTDDKDFQLALIDEAMFNFHRYFFVMPNLARFEKECYARLENNESLNAKIFNEMSSRLFGEGYGDTMTDDPERTATNWMQYQHVYVPYYSFQYSVGLSASHALSANILSGQDNAPENYKKFLGAGWSYDAPDLFTLAGVDMTQADPVEQTFAVLDGLVQRLEELVG
ncbi:MAG: oligoendopeptidase F [Phototrophicaceae bacterium]